jgi:hypothetical protein
MTSIRRKTNDEAYPRKSATDSAAPASLYVTALLALALPIALAAQTSVINSLDPGVFNTALQAGGTVTFSIDGTIVLTNTITLSNSVILDGTNHLITISGGGTVQLFNILPSGQVTLRHLTLANGLDNGDYYAYFGMVPGPAYGGAIHTQGNLNVGNCTFSNNSVISPGIDSYDGGSTYGGAIYNGGSLMISNTIFVNNSAVGGPGNAMHRQSAGNGFGGAIYNGGGTLGLGSDVFSNNTATGGSASSVIYGGQCGEGCGGAIFSTGGVVVGNNIEIVNNTASGGAASLGNYFGPANSGPALGGALYLAGGMIAISNSSFTNNSTQGAVANGGTTGQSKGGCVFNTGSALFSGCSFTGNKAQGANGEDYFGAGSPASSGIGGAIYNTGMMLIESSTLSNNIAQGGLPFYVSGDGMGGAVYNTGSLEIEGAVLSQNSAVGPSGFSVVIESVAYGNGWGGAIYNTGFVVLTNASLSNNFTSGLTNNGEAIYSTGVIQSDASSILVANVTGTPPLTYHWQINGNNMAGATNSTINLGNVHFANSATYDLVINNASGLVTNFEEIVNQPPPPLTISSVTPNTGLVGGGTSVTISGTGFTNGATVSIGNSAATSVTVVSATTITAVTPAANSVGAVNVVVTNGDFQPVVLTSGFTYVAAVSISTAQQGGELGAANHGTFNVTVGGVGIPGYNFVIECSTDLVNWQPLQTNSSPFTFTETNAFNRPLHFYRAILEQ